MKKGNLEALTKKVNLMSEILARPVLRNNTWGNVTTSRLWQQSSVEFGKEKCTMLSERDLSSEKKEDISRRSKDHMTVLTGNGKVQINEDERVFVHDFDLSVTVRLLDGTPAVLLLHALCLKHGYPCEWQKRWNSTIGQWLEVHYSSYGYLRTSCRTRTVIYPSSSLSATSRSKDQ